VTRTGSFAPSHYYQKHNPCQIQRPLPRQIPESQFSHGATENAELRPNTKLGRGVWRDYRPFASPFEFSDHLNSQNRLSNLLNRSARSQDCANEQLQGDGCIAKLSFCDARLTWPDPPRQFYLSHLLFSPSPQFLTEGQFDLKQNRLGCIPELRRLP